MIGCDGGCVGLESSSESSELELELELDDELDDEDELELDELEADVAVFFELEKLWSCHTTLKRSTHAFSPFGPISTLTLVGLIWIFFQFDYLKSV